MLPDPKKDQLYDSISKTKKLAGVVVEDIRIQIDVESYVEVVWVSHDFGFLGGSLGCAGNI